MRGIRNREKKQKKGKVKKRVKRTIYKKSILLRTLQHNIKLKTSKNLELKSVLTSFRIIIKTYTIFCTSIHQKRWNFVKIFRELHKFIDKNNFFHIRPDSFISEKKMKINEKEENNKMRGWNQFKLNKGQDRDIRRKRDKLSNENETHEFYYLFTFFYYQLVWYNYNYQ